MACSEKSRRAGRMGRWGGGGRIRVGCSGRKEDGLGECVAPWVGKGAAARRRRRWRSREGRFIVGFGSGRAGRARIWRLERMMRVACVGGRFGNRDRTAARPPVGRPGDFLRSW